MYLGRSYPVKEDSACQSAGSLCSRPPANERSGTNPEHFLVCSKEDEESCKKPVRDRPSLNYWRLCKLASQTRLQAGRVQWVWPQTCKKGKGVTGRGTLGSLVPMFPGNSLPHGRGSKTTCTAATGTYEGSFSTALSPVQSTQLTPSALTTVQLHDPSRTHEPLSSGLPHIYTSGTNAFPR